MDGIIKKAIERGQVALSEYESKQVIQEAGIAVTRERLAGSKEEAVAFASEIGYPVVLKGCSEKAAHKTEMDLVRLRLTSAEEVSRAYDEIISKPVQLDGVLVQEMIRGEREFVMGMTRDPQFGPCVMFGAGGVFTEVMKDVTFRVAPIDDQDALEMLAEIRMTKLLGEFRGSPGVDRQALVKALVGLGNLGYCRPEIAEIDINPVVISGDQPVAVDALVVLSRTYR